MLSQADTTCGQITTQFTKVINVGKEIITTLFGLLSTCKFDGSDVEIDADKMHKLYQQVALLNGMLVPIQTYISQIDVQLDVIKKNSKKLLSTSGKIHQ